MNRAAGLIAAALACICFAGCVNTSPHVIEGVTPEPTEELIFVTPEPVYSDVPIITEVPSEEPAQPDRTSAPSPEEGTKDALGRIVSGPEHFTRYLTFRTMLVYEEDQDTFLDGVIRNDYSETITCAVDIVFYGDDGDELARARLRTRDGQYLLVLEPGDTVIYAYILTDMTLTDREYELEYDMDVGIKPLD